MFAVPPLKVVVFLPVVVYLAVQGAVVGAKVRAQREVQGDEKERRRQYANAASESELAPIEAS
jgi:hypothetical protein